MIPSGSVPDILNDVHDLVISNLNRHAKPALSVKKDSWQSEKRPNRTVRSDLGKNLWAPDSKENGGRRTDYSTVTRTR